jgi:catechol 2,3-dioxygenase
MIPVPSLRFSHVGLFCTNIDPMVDFYTRYLGFIVTDRGTLPHAEVCFLSRNPEEHHELVLVTGRPAGLPDLILNQLSFRLDTLAELKAFHADLPLDIVSDLDPVIHGVSWSLYVRDPEGNRLEIFVDSEWYIDQPVKQPLDLTMSEDAIRATTLSFCREQPGFKPMAEWKQGLRREIEARLSGRGNANIGENA